MAKTQHRILVVDDEPDVASTLAVIFQSRNYETATALSGEEGIEIARSFLPDCIVCDIVMEKKMNGIDAAMVIQGLLPECKVVFLSGDVAYQDLQGRNLLASARESGLVFDVLQKPVLPRELLDRISEILLTTKH